MGELSNTKATTPVSENDAGKIATINGLAQILDDSLNGQIDVTVTTADVVLTGTPTAPQAQHLFVNASGTLTGNRAITVPVTATGIGKNRLYIVKNGTSGAFTLTFKVAGGTGVTIGQGNTALVFFNGTDIVKLTEGPSTGSDSASASWTPTWTNLTVGNGTVVAKYTQIGKTVFCRLSLVFGGTTAVSGEIIFSLPVTRATNAGSAGLTPQGQARLFDTSAVVVVTGEVINLTTTTSSIRPLNAAGTYVVQNLASATVPFTWATGDEIAAQFSYEAA